MEEILGTEKWWQLLSLILAPIQTGMSTHNQSQNPGSSLSPFPTSGTVGLRWISKMSWWSLRADMRKWLMIKQISRGMTTAQRMWVGVNRKVTFYLFQKNFYTYHVLAITGCWWYKKWMRSNIASHRALCIAKKWSRHMNLKVHCHKWCSTAMCVLWLLTLERITCPEESSQRICSTIWSLKEQKTSR